MGRNRTGPPSSVGHPTAHAPGKAAADRTRDRPARSVHVADDDDADRRQ